MSGLMEFYTQDRAASIQIGKNVYRRVSIPINDFNAACDHYGFVKERTCEPMEKDGVMRCSECDYPLGIMSLPAYCAGCGAKVVE